jgi:hypothetical protein
MVLLRAPTGARISTDRSRVDRRIPYDRRERRMPVLERRVEGNDARAIITVAVLTASVRELVHLVREGSLDM